jgi:hypothetical protein
VTCLPPPWPKATPPVASASYQRLTPLQLAYPSIRISRGSCFGLIDRFTNKAPVPFRLQWLQTCKVLLPTVPLMPHEKKLVVGEKGKVAMLQHLGGQRCNDGKCLKVENISSERHRPNRRMMSVSMVAQRRAIALEERRDRTEISRAEMPSAAPMAHAALRRCCVSMDAVMGRHIPR